MEFAASVAATGCTGGPQTGSLALQERVQTSFSSAGLYSLGIYNCRKIEGSQAWSVHAEGRALDVGGVLDSPAAGAAAGALLDLLLSAGDRVLQRIMFDGDVYDRSSPTGRPIVGGSPHYDHMHVELSWAAARGEIPLELDDDQEEDGDDVAHLIVAWRGAQWVVDGALTSKRGLAQTSDVSALLKAGHKPAVLTEALMAAIPAAP